MSLPGPPAPARRDWAAAIALFLLGWAILCWPWLSGAVTIPWDAKAHFYPQLQFLAQSLHRGEEPFWAPYVFSGSPQVADPQSLIFSPPFLALAALDPDPGFRAFDAAVFGMLGLGAFAIMAYARDRSWHPAGALAAAFVFAFGMSACWRVQHVGQILSLAFWPMALLFLTRALARNSLLYGALAGLAAGLMTLNRDQVALLGLLLLAGAVATHWFGAERPGRRIARSLVPLAAGALAGALVVTGPIVLTILLAEQSNRPAIPYADAARGAMHPALLLTGLIPNLFGVDGPFLAYWGPPSPLWGESDLVLARNMGVVYAGALPFALLLAGAAKGALLSREIRAATIGLALMLLYAMGGFTPVFRLVFAIPGIDLFRRPADALFLAGALAALATGYLVHRIFSGSFLAAGRPWGLAEWSVAVAAFAAAFWLAVSRGTLASAGLAFATSAAFLAAALLLLSRLPALTRTRPLAAMLVLAAFLVADLRFNSGPNESTALPPADFEMLRQDSKSPLVAALKARLPAGSLDRIELAGLGFAWPNASLVHRFDNVLGYNPVRLALYSEATGAEDHVALPDQRRFSPLFPSYRSTLADLLGLRFIATGVPVEAIDPALKPGDLTPLARTPQGYLYENPRAGPRLRVVPNALAIDQDALLRDGRWPAVDLAHDGAALGAATGRAGAVAHARKRERSSRRGA